MIVIMMVVIVWTLFLFFLVLFIIIVVIIIVIIAVLLDWEDDFHHKGLLESLVKPLSIKRFMTLVHKTSDDLLWATLIFFLFTVEALLVHHHLLTVEHTSVDH